MKLKTFLSKITLPLLIVASCCACSRFIEGDVFLDKNANNVRDHGEPVVAGIPFTVTRNNATSKTGITDAEGHFSVTMGINDLDANYCVKVSPEAISDLQTKSFEQNKALKSLETKSEATSDTCPFIVGKPDCTNVNCCDQPLCSDAKACENEADSCTKNSDGDPDCSDADCCDESACSDAVGCKDKSDPNACPKDSGGNPDCHDSRCSAESACNTYSVQPMQACDTTKAAVLTMNLDVPVAMDYSSRIAALDEALVGPISVGDKFGIEISYPASCSFDPYTLPAAFAPVGLAGAFNKSNHELSLDKAILAQPSQVIHQDSPPFGHDKLDTYILRLEAVGTDGVIDGKIKVQPKLTCPDGKQVQASVNIVSFDSESQSDAPAFSINSEISPSCPALGESATFRNFIQAQDATGFSAATYKLSLSDESLLTINSIPSQCEHKGATIECDMSTLHIGTIADFSVNFTMADSVAEPTKITFTSQLDANGESFTAPAIDCNYP